MNYLFAPAAVDPPFPSIHQVGVSPWVRPEFVLPVLSRSVAPLSLLLEGNAIDLGLTSCVISIDPGLAFDVLQLANPALGEPADPVWQLPSALVAAGRESLQSLLECAPQVDTHACSAASSEYASRVRLSVRRACVSHFLAGELGRCNPKKAYLGGLLLDIPEIVPLTLPVHEGFRARLLSAMCCAMPAALVRAAMAQRNENAGISDPLVATIILAEACLHRQVTPLTSGFWACWPEVRDEQRGSLLDACGELDRWTAQNMDVLDPWEFMTRLERRKH